MAAGPAHPASLPGPYHAAPGLQGFGKQQHSMQPLHSRLGVHRPWQPVHVGYSQDQAPMPPQKRVRMATETDTLPSTTGGGRDAAGAQKRAGYPAAAGVVSTRYLLHLCEPCCTL